ncbi:dihydrolipoyl dehydrogenase [Nitrococcus mobilis]|uniref:Dihydrolipoyl dehydrogenase n=1 Tax=Nitrococcus mobilis Nb-231 TaxID=314278 RepID=A4BP48_9GAMM|nr:dihydrolipoyl dehydrogenase [Nitrococcus mobilis]EAR22349.1 Dihydrolipoamide dehydrogenase [Nitrococcus mobilis Nb-231]
MAEPTEVCIPDIGDFENVEIIEVLVKPDDRIQAEDSLITLESDKASMEVPSPIAGVVKEIKVKVGDKVSQGDLILLAAVDEPDTIAKERTESPAQPTAAAPAPATHKESAERAAATHQPAGSDADCDVLVIGAGPGGYSAAFRAADLGLKTLLVERYPDLGGICLNVGCIPSKALLHAAKIIEEAAFFSANGIDFGSPQLDLKKLTRWKQQVVDRLTGGLKGLAKQRKVNVIQGSARFLDNHRVEVDSAQGKRTLAFRNCIIAAGSRPAAPPGFDLSHPLIMDSTDALKLETIPSRLLVIGGGIIGLELATVYHALGSEITVVELLDRLMAEADPNIVKPLRRIIDKRYQIHLSTKVTEVQPAEREITVHLQGDKAPETASFDRVLVATGRHPNSDCLNLEATDVQLNEQRCISVDEQMRTNVANIFAIGDIVGQPMLAHKATHEGKVAAEVCAGEKSAFDARVIPAVAYTDPEVAWVGVTEEQAKAQGLDYQVGSFPWAANGRSLTLGRDEGLTKLIFDTKTERLIGGALVGPNAGDLIAEVALAIEMGADYHDIGLTIHPHPTLSETVGMAAEAAAGTLTDLYIPKRRR